MRVTVLAASGQLGGAERMVLETVRGFSTLGIESTWSPLNPAPARRPPCGKAPTRPMLFGFRQDWRRLATLADRKRRWLVGLLRAAAPLPFYVRQLAAIAAAAREPT